MKARAQPGILARADAPTFFVSQHYVDFLNRWGEPAGRAAWIGLLGNCAAGDPACDRVTASAAFFGSQEFMLKGSFVIRAHKVCLGVMPGYRDFTRDSQRVTGATAEEVMAARDAYIHEWMGYYGFRARYDGLSNHDYVAELEQAAGVTLGNEAELMAALDAGTMTREQVVRAVVESEEVKARTYNEAFVLMEYYGYLRRDPEPAGYKAWLDYLNAHPGEYRTMVNGFVNSTEYRMRFGRP